MLTLGLSGRIWICVQPVDGRKSFDGLSAIVTSHLARDPLSGDLFVFRNRRGDRLKILAWQGDGFALPAATGARHLCLPQRRGGRRQRFRDRAGDDPRRSRLDPDPAATAVPAWRLTKTHFSWNTRLLVAAAASAKNSRCKRHRPLALCRTLPHLCPMIPTSCNK